MTDVRPASERRRTPTVATPPVHRHVRHVFTWTRVSLATVLAFYLLGSGRWGSYLPVPGAPFFISDAVLLLAGSQVVLLLALRRASLARLGSAPLPLLLAGALLLYSSVRFAAQADVNLIALRDFAPYAYAVVGLITFLLPPGNSPAWRAAVYGMLVLHLGWVMLLPKLNGFPWDLPVLGTDAQLFSARPDFDATVLAIGAALSVHMLLRRRRAVSHWWAAGLVLFGLASVYGMLNLSTRAGLLAGLLMLAVAVVAGLRINSLGRLWYTHRVGVVGALVGLAIACSAAIALSPAGGRLVDSFNGGAATGTVSARQAAWGQLSRFVLAEPERAAIGVGFGRNIIHESGTSAALEGQVYQNVRSPHNYVLGTGARLGVAGALLTLLIILAAGWAGFRALRGDPDTLTALAAFVVIGIPVVALLGVVLESPFGAIPYFWAIGQLAVHHVRQQG